MIKKKYILKKTLLMFIVYSVLFILNTKKIKAATYTVDNCGDVTTGYCAKGGSGQCPFCTKDNPGNACCSKATNWTKYYTFCTKTTNNYGVNFYVVTYNLYDYNVCSVGDKYNSSNPKLIYAGNCDCTSGGNYKACCNTSTGVLVNSSHWDVGGLIDDAGCPSGSTEIHKSDFGPIDLNWATNTCKPPCNPSCGDTNSRCFGVTYGNGCTTDNSGCTGTGLNADNNCATRDSRCVKDGVYASNTCGSCTGTIATSTCSDKGSHCVKDGVYFDNGCGTCTGTVPTSTCSDAGSHCVKDGVYFNNGCGTCTGTVPTVAGISGVCEGSNGGNFTTTPTSLCTTGTASAVTASGTTYSWKCTGTTGTCGGATGTTANCSATRNLPPVWIATVIENNVGTRVTLETGNNNQICQTQFNDSRLVTFEISASDPNGIADISNITLTWNGRTITKTTAIGATTTFSTPFTSDWNNGSTHPLVVTITDTKSQTDVDNHKNFKIWDCNVPVSGTLYNGSAGIGCPTVGFSIPAESTNFTSLVFSNGVGTTIPMNIKTANTYGGGNPLIWGKIYTPSFNSDLAMLITTGGVKANTACTSWDINLQNGTIVDPYATSPTLVADFSGVVDQDSWYQAVGGGLMSNIGITNRVPVTCTTPNCAMSIGKTGTSTATNGIVASLNISNTGNSNAKKGNPNDWSVTKPLVSTLKSDYTYFLNQYFWKSGIGTTFNGDKKLSEIGTTGVNFINGNLTIDNNNDVTSGLFLMVVASGDINVDKNVTNLEGIFVSKNFNVGGSNATALNFEGMIKATGTVSVKRTFVNKRTNNTTPAVNFIYRPDFVFNMPAAITKQLTKWQWGN